jgi:hypothetical protein
MKKNLFYSVLAIMLFTSCSKQETLISQNKKEVSIPKVVNEYIIKKGNHYCEQNQLQLLNASSINASVTFDSSAVYISLQESNQGDVNKLIGFSDCGNDHQQNSARLGWSWNGQNVVIYAYAYVNRERKIKTLGNFNINQAFNCAVSAAGGYYRFEAGNHVDSIPRFCSGDNSYRYKLFPYFGGDEVAPHEMRISIVEGGL